MSISKYVRQVKTIEQKYVTPLIKIDRFLNEVSESEIDAVIKSVGGGTLSESVFEAWAFIIAKTSGSKTYPQ